MSSQNPFEAPSVVNPYAVHSNLQGGLPPQVDLRGLLFQQNGILVMHKQAILPDRCIKSNEPTTERLNRTLYWHHPAIYLIILVNLIVYVVIALFVRKTAKLQIPLAERFKRRRIRNMLIAWSIIILGIAFFVAGISLQQSRSPLVPVLLIAMPVSILIGALFGIFGCRVVYAKKIDDDFVWLGGVSREFLASLPEWPRP